MEFLGAEMKKESGQFFKVGSKRMEIQLSAVICSFSKLTIKEEEMHLLTFSQVWETPLLPRQVLDKLEIKGFKVSKFVKLIL